MLAAGIFARWAWIEHQMSLLLVYILGAQEKPALAMFSIMNTQRLQQRALEAAAKEKLPPDQFDVFIAVMSVIDCVQADRNRLAHWVWGTCPEIPDRLILVDPDSMRERELRHETILGKRVARLPLSDDELAELFSFDLTKILVYSISDLERCARDLSEAVGMLVIFREYLNPRYPDDHNDSLIPFATRKRAHDALLTLRLFREALARAKRTKSNPEAPAE